MSRRASTPRRFLSQRMNSLINAAILDEASNSLRTRQYQRSDIASRNVAPDIDQTIEIEVDEFFASRVYLSVCLSPSRSALEDITSLGRKTRALARLYVISSTTHHKCERKVRQAANSANRAFPVLRNPSRTYASVKDRYVSSKEVHRTREGFPAKAKREGSSLPLSLFLSAYALT
jgi:hypothetical protein